MSRTLAGKSVLIVEDGDEYLANLSRFVPGPDYRQSRSAEHARRVIGDERVDGRILPVDYRGLEPAIREAIRETTPSAVICLGLWPGAPLIRLERVAVNVADFEIADNVGEIAKEPLNVGGDAAYLSTLPLDAIQERLLLTRRQNRWYML